jgi:hypothetical protein
MPAGGVGACAADQSTAADTTSAPWTDASAARSMSAVGWSASHAATAGPPGG